MDRKELLNALAIVEPSLATTDLIPVLTHFWFTGTEITAYNDAISISVPFETDFIGSIKGKVLYDFLSKCSASKVEFKDIEPGGKSEKGDDSNLLIKCGRATLKMRLFSEDSFLFKMPVYEEWDVLDIETDDLCSSLDVCLQSIGSHVSEPERNGITVISKQRNVVHMFATDSITLSHCVGKNRARSNLPERFVLSYPFCVAARRLFSKSKKKEYSMYVEEDHAVIVFGNGVKLFGRLIDDMHPLNFEGVFAKYLPDSDTKIMVPLPKMLSVAIERAYVAVSRSAEPQTLFKVCEDNKGPCLRIEAVSEYGTVRDKIRLDGDIEELTVKVDLKRFRNCGLDVFDKVRFTDKCIVLAKGKDKFHLMSVMGK
jgi:DNA polymerase III sliding clamp (beta) subunit (PCNA family)